VPFDGCGVSIHKLLFVLVHFQQDGDMTRWDVQWWPGWHPCFWIEMRLVVINPGSVTETWLPDMWVTAAVPDIQVTSGNRQLEGLGC
jgi:hypothetical protein